MPLIQLKGMEAVAGQQHVNKRKPIRTTRRFNFLSAILALFLWGGWAFYINWGYGLQTGIFSGIVQGIGSFAATFIMVGAITWLFHYFNKSWLRLILPAMITVGCIGSCLVCIHYIIGTPRIFQTILPALSVAFCFCLVTTLKLYKDASLQYKLPPQKSKDQAKQGR